MPVGIAPVGREGSIGVRRHTEATLGDWALGPFDVREARCTCTLGIVHI